ncbi:hypothetical protein [Clostridium estertheticum]|uniref:hypothetical protein n=1 Tax=Clostridium estertheticum TaxID=238834 RepID=UPI001C0E3499|nr:hypothetical protein [Clostridium estertheticum]MBU3185374.1 hypothetical protein [Clostridium estertheticum]
MPNYYFIGINKIIRMLQKNHSLLVYGDSYGRNGCFEWKGIIRMLQKNHNLLGYGDGYGRKGCFGI